MIRSDCFGFKYRLMTLNVLRKPLKQSINKICSCLVTHSKVCVAKAAVSGESPSNGQMSFFLYLKQWRNDELSTRAFRKSASFYDTFLSL